MITYSPSSKQPMTPKQYLAVFSGMVFRIGRYKSEDNGYVFPLVINLYIIITCGINLGVCLYTLPQYPELSLLQVILPFVWWFGLYTYTAEALRYIQKQYDLEIENINYINRHTYSG